MRFIAIGTKWYEQENKCAEETLGAFDDLINALLFAKAYEEYNTKVKIIDTLNKLW